MKIEFDDKNCFSAMVGDTHGITPKEYQAGEKAAAKALAAFRKLSDDNVYGFAHLPFNQDIKGIQELAAKLKGSYDSVCLVGIGGSALGPWAVDCALRGPHPVQAKHDTSNPRLVILDNVDPMFIEAALASMNPKKTIVLVVTKSGSTAETTSTFLLVYDWLKTAVGAKKAPSRVVAITTEGKGDLDALASREGFASFYIPENVGGRFSVLSPVGLVPAALTNVDIAKMLKGAAAVNKLAWNPDLAVNTPLRAALIHWLQLTKKGKSIQVAFPYSNRLWGMAFWFRQLWAESLGKAKDRAGNVVHTGQTPIAALGATDQHSQVQLYIEGPNDKVFSIYRLKKWETDGKIPATKLGLSSFDYLAGQSLGKLIDAECRATAAALTENQRPNGTFVLDKADAEHVGAFFQLLEFETAFAGELLNIDAFDQEGVELGKKLTYGLMGRKGFKEYKDWMAKYEERRKKV
jgi:glucose-6-phosphate isomerase